LIGGTCKRGNAFSGPVLIARGLDFEHRVWSYGVLRVRTFARRPDNFGGHSGRETPLPIPNREVKPACADGTRRATSRESRQPPIFLRRAAVRRPFFSAPPERLRRRVDRAAPVEHEEGKGQCALRSAGATNPSQAARSFSRQSGSSSRSLRTRSPTGGCVTNSAASPSSRNGLIV
jgi:hypothetical protein